ncbi:MAG: hypothetical protein IPK71_03895 [Myxococcales bacterium]|nr:hypothetical protein [Myxococcales bacterium]
MREPQARVSRWTDTTQGDGTMVVMRVRLLGASTAVAVSLCWTACTSFGADGSEGDGGEAGTSEDGGAPDGTTRLRCSHDAPFGAPTALGGLGAYSVEAVRFGTNRSLVYLSLCPPNGDKRGCDMYQGTITTTADTYGSLVPMSAVNAASAYDSYPTVTGDAKHLLFGSDRNGAVKIFLASASAGGVFEKATALPLSFAASNEPYLLADGRTFYFAATGSMTPPRWELYRAEGEAPTFGAPSTVPGSSVNQAGSNQFAPVVTEDELEVFFASSRPPGNEDNFDLWVARRSTKTEPFGPAQRLDGLNGGQNDFPTSISPDACELYYIRKSAAGVGSAFVTRRTRG